MITLPIIILFITLLNIVGMLFYEVFQLWKSFPLGLFISNVSSYLCRLYHVLRNSMEKVNWVSVHNYLVRKKYKLCQYQHTSILSQMFFHSELSKFIVQWGMRTLKTRWPLTFRAEVFLLQQVITNKCLRKHSILWRQQQMNSGQLDAMSWWDQYLSLFHHFTLQSK